MARLHTARYKVLSRYRSYNGGTDTAINLTGDPRRWPNDYGNSGVVHFFGPFLYRSHFNASTESEECERALAHLDEVIRLEGYENVPARTPRALAGRGLTVRQRLRRSVGWTLAESGYVEVL